MKIIIIIITIIIMIMIMMMLIIIIIVIIIRIKVKKTTAKTDQTTRKRLRYTIFRLANTSLHQVY